MILISHLLLGKKQKTEYVTVQWYKSNGLQEVATPSINWEYDVQNIFSVHLWGSLVYKQLFFY